MRPFNRRALPKISPLLDQVVRQFAESEHPLPMPRLNEAVQELSRLFTRERRSLSSEYMDETRFAAAYLRYFLPVNAAKVQVLLDELPLEEDLATGPDGTCSVLDVGSGPGTAGLAVLDWMVHRVGKDRHLRVVSVDRSRRTIAASVSLWESYCCEAGTTRATLKSYVGDLENMQRGNSWNAIREASPYDVIVVGNCLNELFCDSADPVSRRIDFIEALLPLLQPHGSLVILEPALRQISRDLHLVRDRLLQLKLCTVYSPCLHEQPCPALIHPDDWCHEERPWEPPAIIQQIDTEVGFIKDALKFSYLLLRKDGRTIVERRPNIYRVVSELREFKGEKRAWLCHEEGRPEIGRLDRMRSQVNEAFDHWHRGDIVRISEIVRKERKGRESTIGRIPIDAIVEIVRPI